MKTNRIDAEKTCENCTKSSYLIMNLVLCHEQEEKRFGNERYNCYSSETKESDIPAVQ